MYVLSEYNVLGVCFECIEERGVRALIQETVFG